MSRCLFNKDKDSKNTVLVATSGDTGCCHFSGFAGRSNHSLSIRKGDNIQEKQLTTFRAEY
jgi:threonine synthase